ncbi:hypothetical protein NIES4103_30780 [Nostoc sp. NIES-4103]|nr:hypothetical protein NIES4103_30780 [Nostoc sp. NIES-4103]
MSNQRLLAGLLAVTTMATTVAVNISPSYGNNSTNVQYLAQNQTRYDRLKNLLNRVYKSLDDVNKAIDLGKRLYEYRRELIGMANSINDMLNGKISYSQSDINSFEQRLSKIKQQILRDIPGDLERVRSRQRYRSSLR